MRKVILFLCLFISSFIYSQSSWMPTGSMSTGNSDFVYSMAASPNGDLYASSWAVGIYKSTNSGSSWNISGLGGNRVSHISAAPNGELYALSKTVNQSFIHKSTDAGNSWVDVFTGSYPLNYAGGGSIVFPADGSIVAAFAVTVGPLIGNVATFIFKSTNGGNNWFQTQRIDLGFVGGMTIISDNKILLGTSLGGVYYSVNNGQSFSQLNTFPPIFIKTMFKAPDNAVYVSDAFGLNRSTDNGLTWTDAGSQNSTRYLRAAGVNLNGDLFISTDDNKVFYSNNRGDNWVQINAGLPDSSLAYCFAESRGKMYAGTSNSGVFVYDHATGINISNTPEPDFKLFQNYPNPFNPATKIQFSISNQQKISLRVYDLSGKELMTIFDKVISAGVHEINFDGSNLPSGVYFYSLESEQFKDMKQMILIK